MSGHAAKAPPAPPPPQAPPAPGGGPARSEALAGLVRSWARVTERTVEIALRLWKLPLEFGADEDRTLSTSTTTLFYRASSAPLRLACVAVRRVPDGTVVRITPSLEVSAEGAVALKAGPTSVEVTVVMPAGLVPGLYELDLREQGSPPSQPQTYQLYFGRPGQAR